jgi:hypothetical protein
VVLLAFLLAGGVTAQTGTNMRERWVKPVGDTLIIDTLSLVPGSARLFRDST